MKMSDSLANLASAMAKAQAAMGGAHKDSTNPHFKSKYADLSSVVDAIKPCLTENGLAYLQFVRTSEEGVGVETLLSHSSGEYILADPFYVPVEKRNAHGFGSALTYARRYSLAAVCGLKADDDDGNAAADSPPEKAKAGPKNPAFAAPHTARGVALEAFNAMTPEEQQWARDTALEVIALHDDKKDMYIWKQNQNIENEEWLAIWSQLPSNVRSKFKKQKIDHDSQPLADALAEENA